MNKSEPLEFKGYKGSCDYNSMSDMWEGEIQGIELFWPYSAKSINALRHSFRQAVNQYLESRKEQGTAPEQPDYQNKT